MEGKKRYIAIILFLLICLMLFTFATTGDEELEAGNGNGNDIQQVTNKGDSDKEKEDDKDTSNSESENSNSSSSNGSTNNSSSNAGDDEDLYGTGNTDNSAWDKALAAVEELEKVLTDDQLNIARELVEEITNSDQYKELIERVEDAEDAIDATALVEALGKMVEEAANKEDIEDASDYRDEEVLDAVNEIDGEYLEEVKEELLDRIEELNKILDDATAPTVEGIEDGDKTKKDVELTITDDNEVTTTVTKDGQTYEYVEKFTEEGTYEVTVVDSAFNETKLTFTIDKTAPKFTELKSGSHYDSIEEIKVEDATNVTVVIKNQDTGKEVNAPLTEDATYYITATDEAGNSKSIYVAIDNTYPEITGIDENKPTNKNEIVYVKDKFLTKVIIDGKEYTRSDFEVGEKNENFKFQKKITKEGTHTVVAIDKFGNTTTKTFVIDKTAATVKSSDFYVHGLTAVEKVFYTQKDNKITVNVKVNEQLANVPTFTLHSNGKDYVLTDVLDRGENAPGVWLYQASYVIDKDMADGEVTFTISNIVDKAGNVTENVTAPTNGRRVIVDNTAPQAENLAILGGKGYWVGKEYKQYATNDTIVYVNVRMFEELATIPVVTLNDTITLTQPGTIKESNGIWIYSYSYRLKENDGIADGVLQVKVTNIKDFAGNSIELTNADCKMESQSEVTVDRKAPTYKFYKEGSSLAKDEIQPIIIDGKMYFDQNVRAVFKEDGSHFTQYIHNDFVNNENKTTIKSWTREAKNDGEHTMKVTDASGNVTEVTFTIDTTAPTYKFYKEGSSLDKDEIQPTIINGKMYFDQNVRVRFVEETTYFTQYIHNDFVNNENKTTIQTWTREAKNDGEHTMKVTDALGHVTEVTFTIDTTAPTYKFYKEGSSLDKDEIQPTIINGKMYFDQNVRVRFVEETTYFTQYIHNDFVNNENKTTIKSWTREAKNDGEHTMKVTDALGHVTEITFTVDKTAPTYKFYKEGSSLAKDEIQPIVVNGKLYFTQNVRVRFVEETTYFTQYIHNDFINNEDKTTIQTWTREAKTNGEHTMKVTDALGHVTEVTFTIDKIAPELTVKKESVGTDPYYSSISFKLYDNNKVDYLMINDKKFDVGNAQWSDANYDAIKGYLVEGENTATLYDEAGNSTTKTFTIDWTAPTVQSQYRTDLADKRTDVIGSDAHNIVFNIYKDDKLVKTIDEQSNYKRFSIDWLGDGVYKVVVTDIVGLNSEITVTIDHTAPVVTPSYTELTVEGDKNTTFNQFPTFEIEDLTEVKTELISGEVNMGKVGEYTLTYQFTDEFNNSTTKDILIKVVDTTAPVVSAKADSVVYVEYGTSYTELGAIVKDNIDADYELTKPSYINLYELGENNASGPFVRRLGENETVDPKVIGKYLLVYTATDAAGNASNNQLPESKIWVIVRDTTAPTFRFTKAGSSLVKDEIQPTLIDGVYYFNQPVRVTISDSLNLRLHGINSYYDDNNPNRTGWLKDLYEDGEYTAVGVDSYNNRAEFKFVISIPKQKNNKLELTQDITLYNTPFYNNKENTSDVVINGNGHTVTQYVSSENEFNWTENYTRTTMGNIFSNVAPYATVPKITIKDIKFAGTTQSILLGHYDKKYQGAKYFKTELNNVDIIGLNVVSLSSNIAPAVYVYGEALLSDVNLYGTKLSNLETAPRWNVYDLGLGNYSRTIVKDSKIGSVITWTHSYVEFNNTEVDTIDTRAFHSSQKGETVIGVGTTVGRLNVVPESNYDTKYGYSLTIKNGATVKILDISKITNMTYIVIENGATIEKVITSTGEMTLEEAISGGYLVLS